MPESPREFRPCRNREQYPMSFERRPTPKGICGCVVLSAALASCSSTIVDASLLQADATADILLDGAADTGDVGIPTCFADGETVNAELACCTSLLRGLIESDGGFHIWIEDRSDMCCILAVVQADEIAADGGTSDFPYVDQCCCAFLGSAEVPVVCQGGPAEACCPSGWSCY